MFIDLKENLRQHMVKAITIKGIVVNTDFCKILLARLCVSSLPGFLECWIAQNKPQKNTKKTWKKSDRVIFILFLYCRFSTCGDWANN